MADIPGTDYAGMLGALFAGFTTLAATPTWAPHVAWKSVALVDGSSAKGTLMRRHVGGRWQYRSMTDDERIELAIDRTW